jgi:two-component system cell cycle sensor histidine kinase/response regulator CckA
MKDQDKTKEELINEIIDLRCQLSELESIETERKKLKESYSLKIGKILMEMGYLTKQQLDRSLQKQEEINISNDTYKTLGEVMIESGVITSEELHKGLAEQLKRLNNILTLYFDEKLLVEAINTIHNHGFSAKSSDPEEVHAIFNKWKESETQRKRAEEALKELEGKYRVLVENANEAIFVVQNGILKFVNLHICKLTGYSENELTSKPFTEFIYPEDEKSLMEYYNRRFKDEKVPPIFSFRILDKSGNMTRWAEVNTVFITWSGKPAILNFMADITERKKTEEELLRVQKLDSVGILAGGIAHDFNNILTAILGNISLARLYKEPEKVNEKLEKAEKASIQAKNLTQQLLAFSKGGKPIKTLVSIADTLKDSAIFALRKSNIVCNFSIQENISPIEADIGQIGQVVNNIVINAVQASSNGGTINITAENIDLEKENRFSLKPGTYIRISISDQGTGIPEENLQKIFYPYFTTKKDGNGLGLAIAYSVIKNHDGHITVESYPGVGTTFQFYLPAFPDKVPLVESKKNNEDTNIEGKGKIMIMDDTEIVREIVRDMLDNIGYDVVIATDGKEAIELYKSAKETGVPIDAIIMDLNIPGGMGGKETIQNLIVFDPGVKAIVSSGYSNDPIMSEFKKYGFSGVIAKPYKARDLNDVLSQVIERKN